MYILYGQSMGFWGPLQGSCSGGMRVRVMVEGFMGFPEYRALGLRTVCRVKSL